MSNEQFRKRNTFQGLFNAEKEKVSEKTSRSKSKSRSKVNSISKSIGATQRSTRSWRKVEPRERHQTEHSETSLTNHTNSDNIFRDRKKNVEQELMKKIIKLKNASIRVDASLKEQLNAIRQSQPAMNSSKEEPGRLEEMQNFLEEFDVDTRRQARAMADLRLKQLEEQDQMLF